MIIMPSITLPAVYILSWMAVKCLQCTHDLGSYCEFSVILTRMVFVPGCLYYVINVFRGLRLMWIILHELEPGLTLMSRLPPAWALYVAVFNTILAYVFVSVNDLTLVSVATH